MSTELALDCRVRITSYVPSADKRHLPKLWLIEYVGDHWPKDHTDYIILRDEDYKRLAKPRKNGWLPRDTRVLLPENIPVEQRAYRYAKRYLRHYFEGDWSPGYDFDWALDPRRYLKRGDYDNFYLGVAGDNGYLRNLDGTILSRKVNCEFWELSYYISALAKTLEAHKKWSDVRIVENTCSPNWSIAGRHYLRAKYIPSAGELEKLANRPDQRYPLVDVGESHGVLHDRPEVRKHTRLEKVRDKGYDDYDDDWF